VATRLGEKVRVSRGSQLARCEVLRKHFNVVYLVASATWVALLYGPGANGGFVYDDLLHIQYNNSLASWGRTLHYFRVGDPFARDLLGGGGTAWRPLMWLTLSLDYRVWGLNPLAFHITSLVLDWMAGFFAFRLLVRLEIPRVWAAAACFLWLGLPINSEAVAWMSAVSYPLMFCFLCASLLAADSWLHNGSKLSMLLWVLTAAAALLSNEEGLLALPLAFLLMCFRDRVPRLRCLALLTTGTVLDIVYSTARWLIRASLPAGAPLFPGITTTFFRYLHWMILPLQMSVERSTNTPSNVSSIERLAGLAGLLSLLVAICWLRKKAPAVSHGLAWMFVALVPFCGIVPIYQGMAERYAYVASFGFVVALIAIVCGAGQRARPIIAGLVLLWALWGAWRLHSRVLDWNDPVTLFTASLEATPNSIKLLYNLGTAYELSGRFDEAAGVYQKILARNGAYEPALVGMGDVELAAGNLARAETAYSQATIDNPSDENADCNLGVVLVKEGKTDRAIQVLRRAIHIGPSDPTAYYDLGAAYQVGGDRTRAVEMYRRALDLKPGDPQTVANLESLGVTSTLDHR
jgi:protein O-mannosyl-transferase